jgi:hypothetical protein
MDCRVTGQKPGYWSETVLAYKVNVTLAFNPKIKKFHLLAKTNAPESLKAKGQWAF